MKILTEISDWKTYTAERGRGTGNEITGRYIIAADMWNWIIAVEYKNGKILPEAYFGNFQTLLYKLPSKIGKKTKDIEFAINSIISALNKLTKSSNKINVNEFLSIEDIGVKIDSLFQTSYHKGYPPEVYPRLFGDIKDV